jgi:hypothetical protein
VSQATGAGADGEVHRHARIVERLIDAPGKNLQRRPRVADSNIQVRTQPGEQDSVLVTDARHFGDRVTYRCGAADERAALWTDPGVKPLEGEPAVR